MPFSHFLFSTSKRRSRLPWEPWLDRLRRLRPKSEPTYDAYPDHGHPVTGPYAAERARLRREALRAEREKRTHPPTYDVDVEDQEESE